MKHPPLKLLVVNWRSRWLVLPSWNVLHRVSEIEWEGPPTWGRGQKVTGHGTTVCGQTGSLYMPGILSRMGLPRCAHCCRALGVPPGNGAPFNDETLSERQRRR